RLAVRGLPFFCQAEDGIRDFNVTGVQTCALPIYTHAWGYAHLRTTAEHWLGVRENDIAWATAAPGWQKWVWSPFLAVLGSGATEIGRASCRERAWGSGGAAAE